MNRFLVTAATAAALMLAAPAAQAATVFNLIDQGLLDSNGTEDFGANIDSTGVFSHSFAFSTTGLHDASGSVITIRTASGKKDIDFTAIDLDGAAFTPDFGAPGHEPQESWSLFTALIGPGPHAIHVHGQVMATGKLANAASYGGTVNLTAVGVPEPAAWSLMIMGFGAAGAVLRRRNRTPVRA
jgi:hypothetical protein